MGRFLKETEKEEIFNDYKNYISVRKLAKKYHTNCYAIGDVLLEKGIDIHDPNKTVGVGGKPLGYWDIKENNENAAKICRNKSEFSKKFSSAYRHASKNGWLDEYSEKYFSSEPKFLSYEEEVHVVYVYEIQSKKAVYVGRTSDLKRRDRAHRDKKQNDSLYQFCFNNNVEIPKPIILDEYLTAKESQEKEDIWVKEYLNNGWTVINKAKTGVNIGSLGAIPRKWTYETCKLVAKNCINKEDFKKKYPGAYNASRTNKWINEYFPFNSKRENGCFDTLENCKAACSKFKTILEIREKYPFLYQKISKNKWTEEIRKFIGETKEEKYKFRLEKKDNITYLNFNKTSFCPKNKMNDDEISFFNLINHPEFDCKAIIDKKSIFGKLFFVRVDKVKTVFLLVNVKNNGVWFSNTKNSTFSQILNFCENYGYRLITIYDTEFKNKKEIIKNKIYYFLGINKHFAIQSIYGRNCIIKNIYKSDAKDFLDKYHIQGFTPSSVYLGAFYNEILVAVMTFKNGGINREGWELNRFATNPLYNYCGVGGKLFKYFLKEYNPNKVVSFADRRWGIQEKNIYSQNNFIIKHITALSYAYFNRFEKNVSTLYHKLLFNKNSILKKYGTHYNINKKMTESEMMKILGYDRIYDCGLIKYVWENKK